MCDTEQVAQKTIERVKAWRPRRVLPIEERSTEHNQCEDGKMSVYAAEIEPSNHIIRRQATLSPLHHHIHTSLALRHFALEKHCDATTVNFPFNM